jgi:SagB-type dehydrogenase family enzyme
MKNGDIAAAWAYHDGTKHSYQSVRSNRHVLDWANQPLAFKVYPEIERIALPRDMPQTGVATLAAISANVRAANGDAVPDLQDLARILFFSAGITKARKYTGGEIYFRAAACTGALYEIELYVVTGELNGLDAGVYHFNPADMSLGVLRKGDFRGNLAQATAMEPAVAHAPAMIVCSGTYWRNAWKYQARTYRHFGWDNGTLLANMLAISVASGLPAEIVLGFVDAEVNRLLDLDTRREVSLSVVPVGRTSESSPAPSEASPLGFATIPVSKREVEYPAMLEMHEASSLASAEEVALWRERATRAVFSSSAPEGESIPLRPLPEDEQPADTIEEVILRRGSTRTFDASASITLAQLSTILDRATRGLPADFLEPGTQLNDVYVIVHSVEGLAPGAYFFDRERKTLALLKPGKFRTEAYRLGLEQQLPADACADVFFLADLNRVLETYGNRGYRAVQLEAGTIGGKMYLAAYALRLGASGLTFFDDEVVQFFSPHSKEKSAIFLLAIGKPLSLAD